MILCVDWLGLGTQFFGQTPVQMLREGIFRCDQHLNQPTSRKVGDPLRCGWAIQAAEAARAKTDVSPARPPPPVGTRWVGGPSAGDASGCVQPSCGPTGEGGEWLPFTGIGFSGFTVCPSFLSAQRGSDWHAPLEQGGGGLSASPTCTRAQVPGQILWAAWVCRSESQSTHISHLCWAANPGGSTNPFSLNSPDTRS